MKMKINNIITISTLLLMTYPSNVYNMTSIITAIDNVESFLKEFIDEIPDEYFKKGSNHPVSEYINTKYEKSDHIANTLDTVCINNSHLNSLLCQRLLQCNHFLDDRCHYSSLKGHTGLISCLCYIPEYNYLASGSHDCTVRLWDMTTLQSITMQSSDMSHIFSLHFFPPNLLGSASYDGLVRIWNIENELLEKVISNEITFNQKAQPLSLDNQRASSISFIDSNDNHILAETTNDNSINITIIFTFEQLAFLTKIYTIIYSNKQELLINLNAYDKAILNRLPKPIFQHYMEKFKNIKK